MRRNVIALRRSLALPVARVAAAEGASHALGGGFSGAGWIRSQIRATRGRASRESDSMSGLILGMAETRGRPGRAHKGDRDQFISRPPRPVGDEVRRRAEALGMSYSDFIAMILAEGLGMPEHAPPVPAQSAQGSLLSPRGVMHKQSA